MEEVVTTNKREDENLMLTTRNKSRYVIVVDGGSSQSLVDDVHFIEEVKPPKCRGEKESITECDQFEGCMRTQGGYVTWHGDSGLLYMFFDDGG